MGSNPTAVNIFANSHERCTGASHGIVPGHIFAIKNEQRRKTKETGDASVDVNGTHSIEMQISPHQDRDFRVWGQGSGMLAIWI